MTRKRNNKSKKRAWVVRFLGILIFALAGIFLILKLYTDYLIHQAEAEYPPGEFVSVEELQLHYVSKGSGRPVVFIPGGSGKIQDFTLSPLFDLAAAQYRAVFIDRPGLGYSERSPYEDSTPPVQSYLIHSALKQLDIEKPVLVGQSWGGVIALQYALDYPDDLAGIVLLGTAPYPRERSIDTISKIVQSPILGDLVLHTLYVPIGYHFVGPALLEEAIDYFAPLDKVPASYSATLGLELRPSHVKAGAAEERIIPAYLNTLCAHLTEISVPVVIVAGDQDTHAIEQSPRLAKDIADSSMIVVEGADHLFWFSLPEVVISAIQDAWAQAD